MTPLDRCALIHCHRPDLMDYHKLDKTDRQGNTKLAFMIAAEHLNIPVCGLRLLSSTLLIHFFLLAIT